MRGALLLRDSCGLRLHLGDARGSAVRVELLTASGRALQGSPDRALFAHA